MGQIQLNLILQEFIVAHPSGSSGGASKESRTFSFWRFATESENWDFLDMSTIVKVNDYHCRLSENYPLSLITDVQFCSPMRSLSPVNLLRSKRIESATHPTISWVCFENRGAVHLWSELLEKLLVRNIWKLCFIKKLTSTPFHLHRFIVDFWSL